jgi:ribosome-binding ATPase YchF (GTP1/OBG family)
LLSGFGLLTRIPMLVVVNLAEGGALPDLGEVGPGVSVLGLQGRLEMEIAQLPENERRAFLAEYGIPAAGRERVLQASYELLGLQSFFTVGDDEVRAWTLPRGANALEAAGTIHSDLARGFIRAEVIPVEELLALGGLAQARARGRLRQEGKDYLVADGDIVHIKFNV